LGELFTQTGNFLCCGYGGDKITCNGVQSSSPRPIKRE
jgi:hypothetical protein